MPGFYVLLAVCAGVVVLALIIARRAAPQETQQDRIESLVVGFLDYVEDPAREAWKFKDADWQREAEQWLAINKYGGLPEFRSVVGRKLAAAAKDHYSETMRLEVDGAFEEYQQDRRR